MTKSTSLIHRVLGDGRYKILELCGNGAYAEVYRGRQLNLDRDVAIKILNEEASNDEAVVKRFHQEAAAIARFEHPNIIKIFDHGTEGDVHYYVMSFLPHNLRSSLQPNQPLSIERVLQIAHQIAGALAYAANTVKYFVHRDIKPENIMLDRSNNVILSDFGLVRGEQLVRLTIERRVLGTPIYMSPEQVKGQPLDARSDLYSLGILLFECATGAPPFLGEIMAICHKHVNESPPDLRKRNPAVPEKLEALILKLLNKHPFLRYQSAKELVEALEEFSGHFQRQNGSIDFQPNAPVTQSKTLVIEDSKKMMRKLLRRFLNSPLQKNLANEAH